ncbi:macro domain-containing protein [Paenibacillus puerhi]|uniref:macro domain-containing protein n=1 Tax=Paenibacillus puerhi TaxID=2692622 RepID=UPI00135BACB9|nr:macro domain-containing protein [Paenibacillus puerhi]
MFLKWKAFFSLHAWRHSLTVKAFFGYWLAVFAVIWTFMEFTGYFFTMNNEPVKPNVWLVLGLGIVIAAWMSRPRLTRTVRMTEKDMQLQVAVDNLFRLKDASLIIPSNCCFKHDHIDEDAVIAQFRRLFFTSPAQFDQAVDDALRDLPAEHAIVNGQQVKKYPVGTVVQLPLPGSGGRYAYILASSELNEYGRGVPHINDLQAALSALWNHIGERGNTRPLAIPMLGSGRQRLTQTRLELLALIVQSFLRGSRHRKFTSRLTLVIHPNAYLGNKYNLDDVECYLACADKFNYDR